MSLIGLKFPFQKGQTSFPAQAFDDQVIEDNIKRILLTPRGSRVMRPDVGSNLWSFIFQSIGPVLRARVDSDVRRALAVGEPRVTVVSVDVYEETDPIGQLVIYVDILYQVNASRLRTAVPFTQP